MTLRPQKLICVACLCGTLSAFADDKQANIDTIVVSASRLVSDTSDLAQSVQIITREQIEHRQAANVTELLRQIVGANIIQQGGRGGVTSIVLRGGEANFTVVMIDGVKVNDATNTRGGSYDFSNLDISSIDRIEIVRAPMSTVYGSDALAGVINIVTQNPDSGARVGVEVGSHGLGSVAASLAGQVGVMNAAFDVHLLEDPGDVEGANYDDWGANGRVSFPFAEQGEAGFTVRFQDSESTSFPEDSGGPLFAVRRDVDRREVRESHLRVYLDQNFGASWHSNLAYSQYERDESYTSPGIAPGVFDGVPMNSADAEFSRKQFVFSIGTKLLGSAALLAGAEWQNEKGISLGVIDFGFTLPTNFSLERDTVSAFTEASFRLGRVVLQGGLRWDDIEGVSDEASAQIGAVYKLADEKSELRFNWGQGFKAPSFFALAHPLVGNPDLNSETATSVDIGFRRQFDSGNGNLELSIYRNEYQNLIDFDPILFVNVNRSKVTSEGAELSSTVRLDRALLLSGHVSYTDSEIKESNARLRGRPRWRAGAVIDWKMHDQWRLVFSLLLLDKFWEVSIPTGGMFLDEYQRLDLSLTYSRTDKLRFGFALDNLLGEDYQEAVGFSSAGIRGRINAQYSF